MAQITEDYCSFETAKLLKKKGFDEATIGYYYTIFEIPEKIKFFDSPISIYYSEGLIGCIQAPTLQMAMKWLREVHHIFIDIDYDPHEFGDKPYFTLITNMDTCSYYSGKYLPVNRATYEEMAEAAIKYCLENLI